MGWFRTHYEVQAVLKLLAVLCPSLLNAEIMGVMCHAQIKFILNKQNPILIIWLKKRKLQNTVWMNFGHIMLNEGSQSERIKSHMPSRL